MEEINKINEIKNNNLLKDIIEIKEKIYIIM